MKEGWNHHPLYFSVAKVTLQSPMSVCLSVCLSSKPFSLKSSSFIILDSSFLHLATFKLFVLFLWQSNPKESILFTIKLKFNWSAVKSLIFQAMFSSKSINIIPNYSGGWLWINLYAGFYPHQPHFWMYLQPSPRANINWWR